MAAPPPRSASELLVQYARYHRDRRNIATHLVGIPLIVFALAVLMAGVRFVVNGHALTLAWLAWAASALWWLTRGQRLLGLATTAACGLLVALAHPAAAGSNAAWLGWGLGLFVLGWAIQFLGHWYEGRKPAFMDDLVALPVGPMFVVAEGLFAAGWGRELLAEIERRAGPTHLRDLAHPAT